MRVHHGALLARLCRLSRTFTSLESLADDLIVVGLRSTHYLLCQHRPCSNEHNCVSPDERQNRASRQWYLVVVSSDNHPELSDLTVEHPVNRTV